MVQLFYYENRGRAARRILRHDSTLLGGGGWPWTGGGRSTLGGADGGCCRVLLYPDEGWARPAALSSWLLQPVWWSRSRCRVVELCGTRRATAVGKISAAAGNGNHVTASEISSPRLRRQVSAEVLQSRDQVDLEIIVVRVVLDLGLETKRFVAVSGSDIWRRRRSGGHNFRLVRSLQAETCSPSRSECRRLGLGLRLGVDVRVGLV